MNILVTGGAGYIGSHTCVELLKAGYRPVIFDNFSNSHHDVLSRLEKITGQVPVLVEGDIRDTTLVEKTLRDHQCQAVIHFAGLKAVGESVEKPLLYYSNNVTGTLSVLDAMRSAGVRHIVFSSSATVYGDPQKLPLAEDHPLSVTNPYGRSKLMVEDILRDLDRAKAGFHIGILRYFNPIGAHESGLIGEDPQGVPNNLMPYIVKVAADELPQLNIFGNDYPTPDGTGVRDYIHVVDLAEGHVAALKKLLNSPGLFTVNLGTGQGYSVLDIVKAFEAETGVAVPYQFTARRPGDIASCYADPKAAEDILGWRARKTLPDMCRSSWHWVQSAGKKNG